MRAEYPHVASIPTRWMDNDVYGHVNNVQYYSYFDTVINEYLIREGGLDIREGAVVGYCVESNCRYQRPLSFPESIDAGLRVAQLGNSSVRYEIGLFRKDEDRPAAQGYFALLRDLRLRFVALFLQPLDQIERVGAVAASEHAGAFAQNFRRKSFLQQGGHAGDNQS